MKALLLDDTHPLLEEGLIAGGLELARAFEEPLEQLTERHADAEVIIIRSRLKVTKDFFTFFSSTKSHRASWRWAGKYRCRRGCPKADRLSARTGG